MRSREIALKPPIILIGGARSGTTMLTLCFAQLDGVVTWHEPRTVWTVGNARHAHDRFTAEMATDRIRRRIRRAFVDYQRRHGNRRVVEKTPSNALRIPFVHEVMPEARFLHIIRDPRDSVSSALLYWTRPTAIPTRRLLRRLRETRLTEWPLHLPRFLKEFVGVRLGLTKRLSRWGMVYPGLAADVQRLDLVEVAAKQWRYAVETARTDLAGLDDNLWMEVRYEDIVAEPLGAFERVLGFLNLQMTDRLANHLGQRIHRSSVGIHRKRLTPEQLAAVDAIVSPHMSRLRNHPILI